MEPKPEKEKRPYEKPAIVHEEKIEAIAGACGSASDEKQAGGENPNYNTPCLLNYS